MINIINKYNCCGCAACVQVCPKQCIQFNEDEQGFNYPNVDSERCVNCGFCEKVCPVINQNDVRYPNRVYAAKSIGENVRNNSSSGGIFPLIAGYIINEGGVVFGAIFDEKWGVIHSCTESIDGLAPFLGSKYVQSVIGESYIKAKQFLDSGRNVLFTGTPCQIAGLKKFLPKEYPNLLTSDVVCHGVPSPLVWRSYLEYVREQKPGYDITNITFRSKSTGWRQYSLLIHGKKLKHEQQEEIILQESVAENLYMQLSLNDLTLRPSCFECPSKCGKSYSDITLGDFWGIENIYPMIDDNKGISLVMLNTDRGAELFNKLSVFKLESSYELAVKYNSCIERSVKENNFVKMFWDIFTADGIVASTRVLKYLKLTIIDRLRHRLRRFIKR